MIGEPQPAIVELERAGLIRGKVLDVGCGTGEHTILLTGLGYDVLGIDFAPGAVEQARRNAEAKSVDARFEVADAMNLGESPRYDTIVDSALFHIFDDADRPKYVASLQARAGRAASCTCSRSPTPAAGFGPQVSDEVIRRAFTDGWVLEALDATTYRGVVTEMHAEALELPSAPRVDEPAWLA